MSGWLQLSFLWTLPLGLVFLSWLGAKFGARAPLLLFLPFPLLVSHLSEYLDGGIEAASAAASATMDSVPMAFSWAIPYFHLSGWLSRRVGDPRLASLLSVVGAIGMAYVVQHLYAPVWALIPSSLVQVVAVAGVILGCSLLLRLRPDEREVVEAVPTPLSLVGRVVGMLAIIAGLVLSVAMPPLIGAWLLAVLHTFPRLTFEMAVSTHVGNSVTASRQLLAGLPLGVTLAVLWCYALVFLPGMLPEVAVLPVALVLTLSWWGVLVAGYVRRFGVYRRSNGMF